MKIVRYLGGLAILATLGFLATGVLAAPPNQPPGQDTCAHGNSSTPCTTDPSTNGKDCEEHGNNGGVNEDHCLGTTTTTGSTTSTTTPTSTSTSTSTSTTTKTTTTTPSTTTTTTQESTSTPTTTRTSPGTTTPVTTESVSTTEGSTTTTTTPVTTSTPTTTSAAPVGTTKTTPPSTKKTHAVKAKVTKYHGKLPFTGLEDYILTIAGSVMLLTGITLRKVSASQS